MLDQSNKKKIKEIENLENICIHPTKQIMKGQNWNLMENGFSSYFLYCQSPEKNRKINFIGTKKQNCDVCFLQTEMEMKLENNRKSKESKSNGRKKNKKKYVLWRNISSLAFFFLATFHSITEIGYWYGTFIYR